jgi:hypothetical protein
VNIRRRKRDYQHAETMEMSVMFCSDWHVIVTVTAGKSWRAKCKDGSVTRSMNFDVKVAKIGFEKQLYKWISQQIKRKRKRNRRFRTGSKNPVIPTTQHATFILSYSG